jgi:hypothetical protein
MKMCSFKMASSDLFHSTYESHNPGFRPAMEKWPDGNSLKDLKNLFSGGIHKVVFAAYFNGAWQNASVLGLAGEGGKALRGQLFKATDTDVIR